jgi:hypothetical protein
VTMLLSPAGNDSAGETWPGRDVDSESCDNATSDASDDTAKATWPRHDVDAESCW